MELQVQKREILGRKTKSLRRQGLIPAELYGKGFENIHLSVPTKDFKKIFKSAGENTVVDLVMEGKKYPVLIHDISYDPLSGDFSDIDFYKVRMDEKIRVKVPVELESAAPAVKEKNGILVKSLQEIEVEALPANIPHSFKVNLSKLTDIGQSIYVKDISFPSGVKIHISPDTVVVTITAKITEEEELKLRQEAMAGVETVKVEVEEKKVEKEAEKAAEAVEQPKAEAKAEPKAPKK